MGNGPHRLEDVRAQMWPHDTGRSPRTAGQSEKALLAGVDAVHVGVRARWVGFRRGPAWPTLVLFVAGALATAMASTALAASPASGGSAGSAETARASSFGEPREAGLADPAALSDTSGTSCTPEFGQFSTGHWPPACWRPYGPSSPFNVPIPENPPLASDSAKIIKYMKRHHWSLQTDGTGSFAWDAEGARPVYWPSSNDPLVTVNCRAGHEHICEAGIHVRIPAGAQPEASSDGHVIVVEQTSGREYDFWQATTPENGQMTVSAGNSIPIGNDSGTGLGGDASASHLGLLGGAIRAAELAAGKIEHALATTVQCARDESVWPATGDGDLLCRHGRRGPHIGNLLQLNMSEAEIAATGAPAWQRTIMTAMARYGIYVVDTNGPGNREMSLEMEDDLSFTSFGYPPEMAEFIKSQGGSDGMLVGVPVEISKLRVINPCVPQGTC